MRFINVLGSEVSVTTANNVASAPLIRVVVSSTADVAMTIKNAGGTTLGVITVKAGIDMYLRKAPTDTITAGSGALLATPVSLY